MISREQIDALLPGWVCSEGEASDVVISSRVRLARNMKGIPFPVFADEQQLAKVNEEVIASAKRKTSFGKIEIIHIEELSPKDRLLLVEKHLCSPQFIEHPHQRTLIVNKDQSISLMVNEEDHLRIQTISPGFSLKKALETADQVDDFFEEALELCFDESYGYLTACPSNVGTGIRASVMLHLPGLSIVDQVKKVLSALSHIGISIRGLYGEGTESLGDIYQISNSVTLGLSETELTSNIQSVCRQIIEQERAVREALLKESRLQLEDRICRSYGILSQSRIISSQEALKLLSDVKLGVEIGILPGISKIAIKELLFMIRSSLLQQVIGKELSPGERDFYRAMVIREQLALSPNT